VTLIAEQSRYRLVSTWLLWSLRSLRSGFHMIAAIAFSSVRSHRSDHMETSLTELLHCWGVKRHSSSLVWLSRIPDLSAASLFKVSWCKSGEDASNNEKSKTKLVWVPITVPVGESEIQHIFCLWNTEFRALAFPITYTATWKCWHMYIMFVNMAIWCSGHWFLNTVHASSFEDHVLTWYPCDLLDHGMSSSVAHCLRSRCQTSLIYIAVWKRSKNISNSD